MKEETAMDKIMTAMAEHTCEELCKFQWELTDQEELDNICAGCELGQHVCDILNGYNRLNDFEKTQCADLLAKLEAEREKHRWIPVEERLPDKDGFYLVTRALGSDSIVSVTWFSKKRKIWDLVATTSRGGVIAWQPLPEPYPIT